jgi:hypothetical protein
MEMILGFLVRVASACWVYMDGWGGSQIIGGGDRAGQPVRHRDSTEDVGGEARSLCEREGGENPMVAARRVLPVSPESRLWGERCG